MTSSPGSTVAWNAQKSPCAPPLVTMRFDVSTLSPFFVASFALMASSRAVVPEEGA